MRRLAEQLIVPKSRGAVQELRGWACDGRAPQNVVKGWGDTPGTKGVEQDFRLVHALVAVVLVHAANVTAGMMESAAAA
jgi:hypothetical protein